MNIELRFLQKAIEDRNYVSFTFNAKKYTKIKALNLVFCEDTYVFKTSQGNFKFDNMSKIIILKQNF